MALHYLFFCFQTDKLTQAPFLLSLYKVISCTKVNLTFLPRFQSSLIQLGVVGGGGGGGVNETDYQKKERESKCRPTQFGNTKLLTEQNRRMFDIISAVEPTPT